VGEVVFNAEHEPREVEMDGSAYSRMLDGWATAFIVLVCLAPLGLWKLVEIVVWAFRHLRVVVQ
jgi:hypothetical protein